MTRLRLTYDPAALATTPIQVHDEADQLVATFHHHIPDLVLITPEEALAYARLFVGAEGMRDALREIRSLAVKHCGHWLEATYTDEADLFRVAANEVERWGAVVALATIKTVPPVQSAGDMRGEG